MIAKKRSLLNATLPYFMAAAALAPVGCIDASSVEESSGAAAASEPGKSEVFEAEAPISGDGTRSDVVSTVEVNGGLWGQWSEMRYCPQGSRAVGYRLRVESGQGDGDDTALNAVELRCMDDAGNLSTVSAHDGMYGNWHESAFCPNGSVMVGGAVRFEGGQGSGDDTAANDLRVRCSNGLDVQAPGGMGYGNWLGDKACSQGSSVCGIKVRFEEGQGSSDDTGLNAVAFACCLDTTRKTRLSISEYIGPQIPIRSGLFTIMVPGIHTRTYSPESGAARAPLIFVEGFDIENKLGVDELQKKLPWALIDNLTRRGYSVTVVDLGNYNWDSIQNNARRVGDLANRIWASSTQEHPIKFVGASMGGLVVATTVAMKDNWATLGETNPGWNFRVDHISTLDTPHAGAYVPQAVYNTALRFSGLRDRPRAMYAALSSAAAQQMIMVPFNSDFKATNDKWQSYYAKVSGILRNTGIPFVGFVNGGWNGQPQYADWSSGVQNIGWEYRSDSVDFDLWAYTQPSPGGRAARIKADFWGIGGDEDKVYTTLGGNWPIVENSPGGSLNIWQQMANSLEGTRPTPRFKNVAFVPTWSAAGISLALFQALPKGQQDNMTTLESARGPVAHSPLSPLTKIVQVNGANSEHTSNNCDAALDNELLAAFDYTWTNWISRDTPGAGGDGEYRSLMTGIPCAQPVAVQCRRIADGVDSAITGEVVKCTLDGLECANAKQLDGRCDDYEVRFACPSTAYAPVTRYCGI